MLDQVWIHYCVISSSLWDSLINNHMLFKLPEDVLSKHEALPGTLSRGQLPSKKGKPAFLLLPAWPLLIKWNY